MSTSSRDQVVRTGLGPVHASVSGPDDGPTAVLWPSLFSDGPTSWGAQLAELHAIGWRTVLIDPPGTGRSASVTRRFTMEECADVVLDVMDVTGVERAAILGLSWGGFVALHVALAAPERVTAIVLSNTSARPGTRRMRLRDRLNAALVARGLPRGLGRLVVAGMLSKQSKQDHAAFGDALAAQVDSLDRRGLSLAMRSVLVERADVAPLLGRIDVPTLVIAGAEDVALPRVFSDELVAGITGARLETLPHVAHLSPREAPEAVGAALRTFLAPLGDGVRHGG